MSKKAELKKQYMMERKRIQNYMNSNKKKGYIFPEDTLPPIPKNITQRSVNRLKKLTASELLNRSYALVNVSDGTGQASPAYVSGVEARSKYKANIIKGEAYVDYFDEKPSEVTVPQGMTDEIAKTFGFETVESMAGTESGRNMLNAINNLASSQAGERGTPVDAQEIMSNYTPDELTTLSASDKDFAKSRAKQDAIDAQQAGSYYQGSIIYDRLRDGIDSFDTIGSRVLNNFFSDTMEKYGADAVYRTLADIEEKNPSVIQELDEFKKKYLKKSEDGGVGRAFRFLADAFKMNANGDPNYNKRLGRAIEAMEVFGNG